MLNVLIACEESQRVCIEMRKLGHRAFSCDILECSGGHPEWHIQDDVLRIINGCKGKGYGSPWFTTNDGKNHDLGAEIGIPGLAKAQIEYVKAHTTTEYTDPKQATAGSYGAATAGSYGAATAGDSGAATSRGKSATGKNGLSVARGNCVMAKGGLGAIIVIAEEKVDSYDVKEWKAGLIDGETLKPDTWYKLVNGEFVEASDDE